MSRQHWAENDNGVVAPGLAREFDNLIAENRVKNSLNEGVAIEYKESPCDRTVPHRTHHRVGECTPDRTEILVCDGVVEKT